MKNKKAFTIIELMIAVMIMAILALLVIPQIGKYTEKGKNKYYESLANELIIMAKNYYTDNKKELPRGQLSEDGHPIIYKVLTAEELKEGNYITNDIVDTKNNSCETSYVTVENNNGEFEYNTCLICNGETVYGEDCSFGGTGDNSTPECTVALNEYTAGGWINKTATATITGIDESGIYSFSLNGKKFLAKNDKATMNFTESGDYTITVYDKAGNAGTCKTGQINIDKIKPTCSMEIVGETKLTKTIQITGQDLGSITEKSDINKLLIRDKELEITDNKAQQVVKSNGTYIGTVIDKAGNSNTCSIVVTGLDEIPPAITASVTSPIATSTNGVYGVGSVVTVTCKDNESGIKEFSSISNGVQGTLVTNTTNLQQKTVILNTNGQNRAVTATCKDESDNITTKTFYYNVQAYSQNSACGWNSCLTGSNTCSYGCSSCYDSCLSTGTNSYCKTCECWYECAYNWSGCTSWRVYYTCTSCGHCGTGYNSYCIGGNYDCNCSNCYSGSNTCKGGYNTCWHY